MIIRGETADNFIKTAESMEDDVIVVFAGVQLSTYPRSSPDVYLDSFDDTMIVINS